MIKIKDINLKIKYHSPDVTRASKELSTKYLQLKNVGTIGCGGRI